MKYFRRKFNYDSDDYPKFSEIVRKYNLDVELEASGFTKQMEIDLNKVCGLFCSESMSLPKLPIFKAYDSGNFGIHCEAGVNGDSDGADEDEEEVGIILLC